MLGGAGDPGAAVIDQRNSMCSDMLAMFDDCQKPKQRLQNIAKHFLKLSLIITFHSVFGEFHCDNTQRVFQLEGDPEHLK